MTFQVLHDTIAGGTDSGDGKVSKTAWNEAHAVVMASGKVLLRTDPGEGDVQEGAVGGGLTLADLMISGAPFSAMEYSSDFNIMPPIASAAPGTVTLTANTLIAIPFFLSKAGQLKRLAINVTTGAGSSAVRLGLAKNRATGHGPGEILYDGTAETATTGTGIKTATPTIDIEHAGLYWGLLVANGTPTLTGVSLMPHILGANTSFQSINAIARSFTYGTFSDESAQSYTRVTTANSCPLMQIGG